MDVVFPTPLVLCDIGGTNARAALVRSNDSGLEILARLRTADFPTFGDALDDLVGRAKIQPRSLILCGAGPVFGRRLTLTNAPWTLDGPELVSRFRLDQGLLLNDFEAQALALPVIDANQAPAIGPELPTDHGPKLILGPGTGLGVAALIQLDGKYVALPTEAGHTGFAPERADETAIWPFLERAHGRHTAESVISGPGLARVHRARMLAHGFRSEAQTPAEITAAAVLLAAGQEAETVRMFWRLIGRFAGDMAITFSATGGVTLAGGILPRIRALLDEKKFRREFCAKDPVAELTRRIPTRLLVAPDAVLAGMAAIGCNPRDYAIDYAARAWA